MINSAQINSAAMQRFSRLYANHRLAHAYLLVGPQDSGKTQTALSLAQLVNCESLKQVSLAGNVRPAGKSLQAIILMCM